MTDLDIESQVAPPDPATTKWVPLWNLLSGAGGGADLVYNGDFPANTPYTDGDIVVYNGRAYLCVMPTSNAPTPWPGSTAPPVAPTIVGPSYGTTLPSSPSDGQEAILVDSVTAPTYSWRFRFNAQATGLYRWEFVGGAPAYVWFDDAGTVIGGAWTFMAGPRFVVPRAGTYQVQAAIRTVNAGAVGNTFHLSGGFSTDGAGIESSFSSITSSGGLVTLAPPPIARTVAAGAIAGCWAHGGSNATYYARSLSVLPMRVS